MDKNQELVSTKGLSIGQNLSILPLLELQAALAPFTEAADEIEAQGQRAVIDSEAAYQKGSEYLTICQQNWDQLEALRKAVKGPIDDYGKLIQSMFKPLQARFVREKPSDTPGAKDLMGTKMLTFWKAEEKKREEAAAEQQRKNEEAAERLAEEAQERGDTSTADAILDIATRAPVQARPTRIGMTNSFGKSTAPAKRWTADVATPFDVLKAILAGAIPISVIEWKQGELDKIARTLKVSATINGLKVYETEKMSQR